LRFIGPAAHQITYNRIQRTEEDDIRGADQDPARINLNECECFEIVVVDGAASL
jgi:hypothetical protein